MVARGGAGQVKGGWHIKFDRDTPLSNLHLTLLDHVGVHLDSFVDSTGRADRVVEPVTL